MSDLCNNIYIKKNRFPFYENIQVAYLSWYFILILPNANAIAKNTSIPEITTKQFQIVWNFSMEWKRTLPPLTLPDIPPSALTWVTARVCPVGWWSWGGCLTTSQFSRSPEPWRKFGTAVLKLLLCCINVIISSRQSNSRQGHIFWVIMCGFAFLQPWQFCCNYLFFEHHLNIKSSEVFLIVQIKISFMLFKYL